MKYTLLEIVQDIMNDMDGDEVNSIDDTQESWQVAQIVKTTFFELMANKDWPHLSTISVLSSVGDNTKPTHLRLPEEASKLDWIKYDNVRDGETRTRYETISYLYPDEFVQKTNSRNNDNDNIDVITDYSLVKLLIKNDTPPKYWTSFDDDYIVFDGYDKNIETTIQTVKTQTLMSKTPSFVMEDSHVPDVPTDHVPLLLAEAKSVAFNALLQMPNAKAEQQSVRQRRFLSNRGWRAAGGIRYPDYGRSNKKVYSANNNPLLEK